MSRIIIITGASSELGVAISKALARPDDILVLHYNSNSGPLEAMKDLCRQVILVQADFSTPDGINLFCSKIKDADILVNAAASTITGLLPTLREESIERMLNVNIMATVKVTRRVLPSMVAKRKGCIVNISSVAATRGNRGQTVYAGTKGFLNAFTRSLAAEFGAKGVRVNCVAPGPIDTGSLRRLKAYANRELLASVSVNRLGSVEEVAAAVRFIVSDEAAFINGQVLHIDGGFMMGV
ncbi:MAG: short chain dehydrogenase [Deltaproteobacteria bacterium]|nr:MAG: short chain dehydrogenase [Deltaproteobacteria bacterium]HDG97213.1 SDR family oxidoreductase [Desulfobacterales bacterium]